MAHESHLRPVPEQGSEHASELRPELGDHYELDPLIGTYFAFWSSLGWLIMALQIACVVHVFRTGRPYWWIWIILAFPLVGLAAYVFVEVRPTWRKGNWQAWLWKMKSPSQRIAIRAAQLEHSTTLNNRLLLADELQAAGEFSQEVQVLSAGLQGPFKDDAELLLRLSQAQLDAGQLADAAKTFDSLKVERSSDFRLRHKLLQARLWGAQGRNAQAEALFQELIAPRRNEAPRYYLAEFLLATGRPAEAASILRDIQLQYRRGTSVWRYQERQWYFAAKRLLRQIPKPSSSAR